MRTTENNTNNYHNEFGIVDRCYCYGKWGGKDYSNNREHVVQELETYGYTRKGGIGDTRKGGIGG